MQKIKAIIASLMLMAGVAITPAVVGVGAGVVSAQKTQICHGINNGADCTAANSNLGAWIKGIVNVILYIIGAIAVVMIVIGGLRYVLSGGDSSQTKSAKDTILYAVIGLVVAVLAYSIVNFVVFNLTTTP